MASLGVKGAFFMLLVSIYAYEFCEGAKLGKHIQTDSNNINRDWDDHECDYWDNCTEIEDAWELSKGAIIGIVIAVLVIFFGIPILLCFCCAWCCFRGRRKAAKTQVVVAAPIQPQPYPPPQPYPTVYGSTAPTLGALDKAPVNNANVPYPVQQSSTYYSNPAEQNIYEQPPPYFNAGVAQGQPPQTGVGWAVPPPRS